MSGDEEKRLIAECVRRALEEDLGSKGDVTSQALFGKKDTAAALIRSKQEGVVSGVYLLAPLFHHIDTALRVQPRLSEGARLYPGSEICELEGRAQSILAGERTALNFLQHLSGIATRTARLVELLKGTSARLLDTRKTTPSLRYFEKRAVVAGGGANHRFGLFDMILIKDTHVKAAGGAAQAVRKAMARRADNTRLKIEVEVQSLEQFREAVAERPDRIMLDNMTCETVRECVSYLRDQGLDIETEASGNITEDNIAEIARTGVDFVSAGSITHSVEALDIHLIIL